MSTYGGCAGVVVLLMFCCLRALCAVLIICVVIFGCRRGRGNLKKEKKKHTHTSPRTLTLFYPSTPPPPPNPNQGGEAHPGVAHVPGAAGEDQVRPHHRARQRVLRRALQPRRRPRRRPPHQLPGAWRATVVGREIERDGQTDRQTGRQAAVVPHHMVLSHAPHTHNTRPPHPTHKLYKTGPARAHAAVLHQRVAPALPPQRHALPRGGG